MSDHIIEISGIDYVGKSTQADLLTYGTPQYGENLGGLGRFSDSFPSAEHSWDWWFEKTTVKELGGVILEAYHNRLTVARQNPADYTVVERGYTMCRAQIVANFATRRETAIENVVEEVDELAGASGDTHENQPTEILLEEETSWFSDVAHFRSLVRSPGCEDGNFSSAQNDFYQMYQVNLGHALRHYAAREDGPRHIVPVNGSAVDIQNLIRQQSSVEPLRLPELLAEHATYLGLSGLSECGKSEIAAQLAEQKGFYRFKLGSFNEQNRNGEKYAPASDVARNIVRFLASNRHILRATFESFHNPQLAAELKLLLGSRWQTVYVDVDKETRQSRLMAQFPDHDPHTLLEEQRVKDSRKNAQNVTAHKDIADIIVDNSGPLQESLAEILKGTN